MTIASKNVSYNWIVTCTENSVYEADGDKTKFSQYGSVQASYFLGPLQAPFEKYVMEIVQKAAIEAPVLFEKKLVDDFSATTLPYRVASPFSEESKREAHL